MEPFLDDGDQHVYTDRDPYLCLHGILRGPVKRLDPQMLFDPFEEELNLPSTLVQLSNGQSREREVVGQERQPEIVLIVVKLDASKFLWVTLQRVEPGEGDGLIAS